MTTRFQLIFYCDDIIMINMSVNSRPSSFVDPGCLYILPVFAVLVKLFNSTVSNVAGTRGVAYSACRLMQLVQIYN